MKKTWIGTTGDYLTASNWRPISLRNGEWKWTASGSGTNEYYLEAAAGGDPGIGAEPAQLTEDGAPMNGGTAGSLTAGTWDYGDNDTLGFNTIYVRLSDGVDPDTKPFDYLQMLAVPIAGDDVVIPAGSGPITDDLDQSGVALASFTVEEGQASLVGSADGYLVINAARLVYAGGDTAFIHNVAVDSVATIFRTLRPSTGLYGLYLVGDFSLVDARGGSIAIAALPGESSTVDELGVVGQSANVLLGPDVACTNIEMYLGQLVCRCDATEIRAYGGTLTLAGDVDVTDLWALGATILANAAGTITNCHVQGGVIDWLQSQLARTVTNLKLYLGQSWELRIHNQAVTFGGITCEDSQILTGGTL